MQDSSHDFTHLGQVINSDLTDDRKPNREGKGLGFYDNGHRKHKKLKKNK